MTKTRRPTLAAGAVIARVLIQRKLTRMRRYGRQLLPEASRAYLTALDDLADWIKRQPQRTRRPGGIGRR